MKTIHYPRLDTILMVEKTIKRLEIYPNKRQLWLALPKQIMYQTFSIIISYLEESGKIAITPDREIIWTHNTGLLKNSVKA